MIQEPRKLDYTVLTRLWLDGPGPCGKPFGGFEFWELPNVYFRQVACLLSFAFH